MGGFVGKVRCNMTSICLFNREPQLTAESYSSTIRQEGQVSTPGDERGAHRHGKGT